MFGKTTNTGIVLPTLTNPATSNLIAEGYQALDQDGNLLAGTLPPQKIIKF